MVITLFTICSAVLLGALLWPTVAELQGAAKRGGEALYLVCSKLKRNGFERKIAKAFKAILADETKHKDAGGHSLDALITSRHAFQRAADIIDAVSSQRLRMRNEQFGFPVSETRMEALGQRARLSLGRKM